MTDIDGALEATRMPPDEPDWRTDRYYLYRRGWADRGDAIDRWATVGNCPECDAPIGDSVPGCVHWPTLDPLLLADTPSVEPLDGAAKRLIRAAISDGYYEARNDGETMEYAASDAARRVLEVLEGYGIRLLPTQANDSPEKRCGCTADTELAAGAGCTVCGHRDHGRSGCDSLEKTT